MGRKKKNADTKTESTTENAAAAPAPVPPPAQEVKIQARVWMRKGNMTAHVNVAEVDDRLADGWEYSPGLVAVYKEGAGKSVDPEEAVALFKEGWSDTPVR